MTTIYISSTYEDLKDYRRAVYEALRKSGYNVIGMEDEVARDDRPLDACLDDIAKHDVVYVGIFAFRYGFIPPKEHIENCPHTQKHPEWKGLSITEVEFRFAKSIKRRCFVFVAERKYWNTRYIDALDEPGSDRPAERIRKLREYLCTEMWVSPFSMPHELASKVQAVIAKDITSQASSKTEDPTEPPKITWDIQKHGSPFPGLMRFTRKYAPVFFGREAEVRGILDLLAEPGFRFILVSGDSGVGKSSLIDGGVLPRLEEERLLDGKKAVCVRLVPSQGDRPVDFLTRALNVDDESGDHEACALGKQLLDQPGHLQACLSQFQANAADPKSVVLFLDQMEELYTTQARSHAHGFITSIFQAIQAGGLWVIATIRSDFLHNCHHHPDLLKVLAGEGHYPLGPVDEVAMADMIRKPAQCAGLEIPERLVNRIVKGTGSEPGSLPLMSFVLQQLYLKRQGQTLSESVFEAFGGVDGAVKDHVRSVEERLNLEMGPALDTLMARLFQSLMVVDQDGQPTRRRTRLSDLAEDLGELANRLIKERLLCTEGEGLHSTVSITHEKLFDVWPALADWITKNKNDLWLQRQVRMAAAEWAKEKVEADRAKHLWQDERVMDVVQMMERLGLKKDDFSKIEQAFLGPFDRDAMLQEIELPATAHERRAIIGRRLSLLGDPRPGVGLRPDGLPDIAWCEVPVGEVTLGIERKGRWAGLLGGTKTEVFHVAPFFIAKYPVTWVQYEAFLKAKDGFHKSAWWEGCPYNIDKPGRQFNPYDNHPAESLCWWEALAFCRWLSDRLGCEIELPTEWQWQQAATGGDPANVYPWGPDWDNGRANTDDSELGRTTAVGLYPHGASPVGALDMAGNVWEWCSNEFERPGRFGPTGEADRVVRGGSCFSFPDLARAAFRYHIAPLDRSSIVGFRVVCASPIS